MVDILDIEQNLKILGLTNDESRIYRLLLSENSLSVVQIARKLNIPRTTLYRIVDVLKKKGFVEVMILGGVKKVKAAAPDKLDQIIHSEENKLQRLKSSLVELEKTLKFPEKNKIKTEVKFYHGISGMKQLVWNVLNSRKTMGYTIWGRDLVIGKDFDSKIMDEYKRRKMKDYIVIEESTAKVLVTIIKTKQKNTTHPPYKGLQKVRVLSNRDFCLHGDTYIYEDVYAVNYWEDGEIVGVEIHNSEIAKIQKGIFSMLWQISEPFNEFLKKYGAE